MLVDRPDVTECMLTSIVDMASLHCDLDADEEAVQCMVKTFNLIGVIPFPIPVWQVSAANWQLGKGWTDEKYQLPSNQFLCNVLAAAFRLADQCLHVERLTVLICRNQEQAEAIAHLYAVWGMGVQ
jgi:hypothetical protein